MANRKLRQYLTSTARACLRKGLTVEDIQQRLRLGVPLPSKHNLARACRFHHAGNMEELQRRKLA